MHALGYSGRCNKQIWDKLGECRRLIRCKPHPQSTEEAVLRTEK